MNTTTLTSVLVGSLWLSSLPVLASGEANPPTRRSPGLVEAELADRLRELIENTDEAQYKTISDLPPDRSFTVGEYPALVDFQHRTLRGFKPLVQDVVDASGSSFMGLWFLSQAYRILGEVDAIDTEPMREAIRTQVERARLLPRFFQGTSKDVWSCPPETMGWYPLVDGYRLPALLPDAVETRLSSSVRKNLANLSDGDIWAWSMAIDDSMPGMLEYNDPITAVDIYAPLLGSKQDWNDLDPDSQDLYLRVRGEGGEDRFPLGTFYGTSAEKAQHFSAVVNANVLSSIPLLDDVPDDYREDIANAVSFVDDATYMALRHRLSWRRFAYDYYTIPVAPVAYVVRAHKRILEIGRSGYPRLLGERTVAAAVRYVSQQARKLLADPDLYTPEGAEAYASLVYCFDAMMNLRFVDRGLFEDDLVEETMHALLTPNPASHTVAGTGPYLVVWPIWADMASVCFVVPPLVEAFSLYLLLEG